MIEVVVNKYGALSQTCLSCWYALANISLSLENILNHFRHLIKQLHREKFTC
jgi:hypothetical protein